MNIFIDTNILLDFYRLSSGDLEELRKIAKLSKTGKLRLFISDYLKDEFFRSREGVIASAVDQFRKSHVDLQLPYLVRIYSESMELHKLKEAFNETKNIILENVHEDIQKASLIADSVIIELFESTDIQTLSEEEIKKGVDRSIQAKPPGKRESCGDAIHWEWLLTTLKSNEDLVIISRDKDYESPLHPGTLSTYLQDEWKNKKASNCILFSSLEEFLTVHFPYIKLADEVDKLCVIEQLETSCNFKTTHDAINKLKTFDDFKKSEILRLINAYLTNDQISRILGDDDVREFAFKLCEWAIEAKVHEEVEPLVGLLEKLEPTESGSL